MKNKYILLLSTVLCLGSLAACGSSADDDQSSAPVSESVDEVDSSKNDSSDDVEDTADNTSASDTDGESTIIDEDEDSSAASTPHAQMTEQTILEYNGVTIKATAWDDELSALHLSGDNTTDQNYSVILADTSVNGYMMEPTCFMELNAQASGEGDVQFLSEELADCNITDVSTIETKIVLLDPTTYTTLYTSETITISANPDGNSQTFDETGETIYNEDGLKLISKGMSDDPAFGKIWKVYIANDTDHDISLYIPSAKLNGVALDTLFTQTIPAGKKAIGAMTIFQEDLDSNQITTINTMEIPSIEVQDPLTHEAVSSIDNLVVSSLS
ncbi:MAG: hypothetical protein EOM40_04885 [Clostridia bacterium]|nr:hypothetical protein [Clostridia bacterium]